MRAAGVKPLLRGQIVITAAEAARMGIRCVTEGDHEGCRGGGCMCGCHRLVPWPWEHEG